LLARGVLAVVAVSHIGLRMDSFSQPFELSLLRQRPLIDGRVSSDSLRRLMMMLRLLFGR